MLEIGANLRDVCIAAGAALVSVVSYIFVKRSKKRDNNRVEHKPDDKPTK